MLPWRRRIQIRQGSPEVLRWTVVHRLNGGHKDYASLASRVVN